MTSSPLYPVDFVFSVIARTVVTVLGVLVNFATTEWWWLLLSAFSALCLFVWMGRAKK